MIQPIINQITACSYRQLKDHLPVEDKQDRNSVASVIEEIICESLSPIETSQKPFIINVNGIPGSGKTTYCQKLIHNEIRFNEVNFSNVLYLTFDRIMTDTRLPYNKDVQKGLAYAFNRWEIPARIAGYELLKRALEKRVNVLFEHSSSIQEHLELFKTIKNEYNYDVHFIYINVEKELAKERVRKRAEKENRIFSPERIEERCENLCALLPEYKKTGTTFKQIEQ